MNFVFKMMTLMPPARKALSDEYDDAWTVEQPRVHLWELLPSERTRRLLTRGHALLPLGSTLGLHLAGGCRLLLVHVHCSDKVRTHKVSTLGARNDYASVRTVLACIMSTHFMSTLCVLTRANLAPPLFIHLHCNLQYPRFLNAGSARSIEGRP